MELKNIQEYLKKGKTLQKKYEIIQDIGIVEFHQVGIIFYDNKFCVRHRIYIDNSDTFFLENGYNEDTYTEFDSFQCAVEYINSLNLDISDFGPAKGFKII